MLVVREAQLDMWQPDFSASGQADPTWTRVRVAEGEIANGLEAVEWDGLPTQLVLCEQCGISGCEVPGHVDLSRLGDWVLCTTARHPFDWTPEARPEDPAHALVSRWGGIAIDSAEWARWRERVEPPTVGAPMPAAEGLPAATGQAIADAWRMSVVGPGRAEDITGIERTLRENAISCQGSALSDALDAATRIAMWLGAQRDEPIAGRLARPDEIDATIATFGFDAPAPCDWAAVAMAPDGSPVPALAPDLLLVPDAPLL